MLLRNFLKFHFIYDFVNDYFKQQCICDGELKIKHIHLIFKGEKSNINESRIEEELFINKKFLFHKFSAMENIEIIENYYILEQ